jgi:Transposase DDE domain
MLHAFRKAVVQARQQGDLYFAAVLEEQHIREAMGTASSLWQGWVYTPAVTVWVFLSQCLSADHSCREAVARLVAWRVAQGRKPCSPDTGAYCTARDQLPEEACRELVCRTGRDVEAQSPDAWRWHGRQVRVVDGTTITLPDTPANQAEYPQQKNQQPGCGLPILRLVALFSLSVGTVLDAAIAPYQGKRTGENSLFRRLHHQLNEGDVVLADRYFSGWFDIALLQVRGVDVVVRKHQLRDTDFRQGTRLGSNDHLVRWRKPQRPEWMSRDEYAALPDELVLREVRVRVTQRGFRTRVVLVVATLVDAEQFSKVELAKLYRRRWQAELHLRSLKIVLQMDHLRCKEPYRVRNELQMHLLSYNLIRRVMVLAALHNDIPPWQISFKGALQTLVSFLPLLGANMPLDTGLATLLDAIASHAVDNRPDRYEPRRVKRRPKNYKYFRISRQEYRKRMK